MSGTLTLTGNGDFNGDLDVDGTLETDALTINGVTLAETISDTVGAMVTGNTETGITVTYDDSDNTLDFVVGTLNQDTTGTAANATLAATVTVTDSNANTNFPIVFHDESNALLDDTGALRYNPSTGELLVPKLTVAGTTTTVDTVTMNAANAVVFEGATADAHETTLTIVDPTADRTINLPNVSGTIPVLAAASNTAITSTPAELNILDGVTSTAAELNLLDGSVASTVVNSKAVIYGSSGQIVFGDGHSIGNQASSDNLLIKSSSGENIGYDSANGSHIFYNDATENFRINDDGEVRVTGNIVKNSGDFTLDVAGDITLDADGKDYLFKDGGTLICTMSSDNTDFTIRSEVQDRDLKFEGNDNGSVITPLTLDMSEGGRALFTDDVLLITDNKSVKVGAGNDLSLTSDGTNGTIATANGDLTLDVANDIILDADGGNWRFKDAGTSILDVSRDSNTSIGFFSAVSDMDMVFKGNDGGSTITALTLDMSDGGTAIFNHDVNLPDNGKLQLGASQDLQIYHNSTSGNSFIADEGTGGIILSSGSFTFQNQARDETHAVMTVNGSVDLYFNNVKKFETTATGAKVSGGLVANSAIESSSGFSSDEFQVMAGTTSNGSTKHGGVFFSKHADSNSLLVGQHDTAFKSFVVKGDGKVLLGLTSSTGNGGVFQVKRTDAGACGYFETNAGSSQNIVDIVQAANVGASQALRFHNNGYGNIVGSIGFNTSSTSFNTSSDYRLKENVTYDFDATSRVKQLKPCRFNFIADADTTVDGFLAHEVSSVVQEAITGEKDGTQDLGTITDEDNNVIKENALESEKGEKQTWTKTATENVYQSIDQSKLIPLLTKALQEQQATIEALTARIVTLENA
jgi:hypothetical protein